MRVFLDANVLFTAAYRPEGAAHSLISLDCKDRTFFTCTLAVEEARRNLMLKAFRKTLGEFRRLLEKVEIAGTPSIGVCPFPLAAKDLPLYWAAKAGKATHFLTGDLKDFGPYMDKPRLTEGILIQTVRTFIDSL